MKKLPWAFLSLCCLPGLAAAYDGPTHEILTESATLGSVLYDVTLLKDLGYFSPATDVFPGAARTLGDAPIVVIVREGAGSNGEDDLTQTKRVFNHFFDPQHNEPDTSWLPTAYKALAGQGLWTGLGLVFGHRSPDWALEEFGDLQSTGALQSTCCVAQNFSFRNGQEHYFAAMTSAQSSTRRQELGQVFRTIGQVVHHLQDMAQPQHARNDPHVPGWQPYGSWYEGYTHEFVDARIASEFLSVPYNNNQIPTFPTAREFWTRAPIPGPRYFGMADFSAFNYVSAGTMYTGTVGQNGNVILTPNPSYPLPGATSRDGTSRSVQTLSTMVSFYNHAPEAVTMDFIVGSVYDEYTGTSTPQRLLAGSTVFSPHLSRRGMPMRFGVNSAVFESNYPVLLPRAVAFSKGLINHFFRGRLNIARSGNTSSWVITNTGTQDMNGEFRIYQDDANGVRTQTGSVWTQALAAGAQTTVNVTEPPLATSRLTVVFRGQIGQEGSVASGFYAVAAKSISFTPITVGCSGAQADLGGVGGIEYVKEMGTTAGDMQVQFEAYGIPDGLTVKSENAAHTSLVDTGGLISGFRSYSVPFSATTLGSSKVRVKVTAPDPNTAWTNIVGCPGQGLTIANGALRRVVVHFRFGSALNNAAGSCTVQAQIDRGSFFTATVTSNGGSQADLTLTEGPGHELRFGAGTHSCTSAINLLEGVTYTDTTGTHPLGNMTATSPLYFNVN